MRRLAAALDVNPMSIYHHVPGKGALLDGLVDRVFGEFALPDEPAGSWQDAVHAWADAYRDLARSHPALVLRIVADPAAVARASALVVEPLYAAFREGGFAPVEVARAVDTLVDFVHGFALAETAQRPGEPPDRRELADASGEGQVSPARHQAVEALPDDELRDDLDAGFQAGVAIVVAGVAATARAG